MKKNKAKFQVGLQQKRISSFFIKKLDVNTEKKIEDKVNVEVDSEPCTSKGNKLKKNIIDLTCESIDNTKCNESFYSTSSSQLKVNEQKKPVSSSHISENVKISRDKNCSLWEAAKTCTPVTRKSPRKLVRIHLSPKIRKRVSSPPDRPSKLKRSEDNAPVTDVSCQHKSNDANIAGNSENLPKCNDNHLKADMSESPFKLSAADQQINLSKLTYHKNDLVIEDDSPIKPSIKIRKNLIPDKTLPTLSPKSVLMKSPLKESNILDEPIKSPGETTSKLAEIKQKTPVKKACVASNLLRRSPRNHQSPIKSHSPRKSLTKIQSEKKTDFEEDLFEDSFIFEEAEFLSQPTQREIFTEIDFSSPVRCKVDCWWQNQVELYVSLESLVDGMKGTIALEFPWSNVALKNGCIVSVKGERKSFQDEVSDYGSPSTSWVVPALGEGFIIVHSDMLLSGTTIVGSLFCKRRSILSHLLKEPPGSGIGKGKAMAVGNLAHDLIQTSLKRKLKTLEQIQKLYEEIMLKPHTTKMLFLNGLNLAEVKESVSKCLGTIAGFIQTYVGSSKSDMIAYKGNNWIGSIDEVTDIEENMWCPNLGMKGKIDVTVNVSTNSQKKRMPLEIKSGKSSFSVEHRGQVMLYCMMMDALGLGEETSGLLLYLSDGAMKEVTGGQIEKRDLLLLRNDIACAVTEATSVILGGRPSLPSPISHPSCLSCPQRVVCSMAFSETNTAPDSNYHISRIKLSHLSPVHCKYFWHWLSMLLIEGSCSNSGSSLPVWATTAKERVVSGTCVSDLTISSVSEQGSRYSTVFCSPKPIKEGVLSSGQFVIVSSKKQVAIGMGSVIKITPTSVTVLLEKDLHNFEGENTLFYIDRYKSNASNSLLSSFLLLLLEDTTRAKGLRSLIIDKELPKFSLKLSGRVRKIGGHILARLNPGQVRAILQVLASDSYIIIKGMPGTGKTRMACGLLELLVALGKTCLVVSHTHSAVDNILSRLPSSMKNHVIRLGGQPHPEWEIGDVSEDGLTRGISSIEELEKIYLSKSVVAATCLGAGNHGAVMQRRFDYCLVDEASQVLQPETLAALYFSNCFVLLGDPEQLPPLVTSCTAREGGMDESLMERLDRPAVTTRLESQYRMNSVLTEIANKLTYSGYLKCADDTIGNATLCCKRGDNKWPLWLEGVMSNSLEDSFIVLNVTPENKKDYSRQITVNVNEAKVVETIVSSLKKCAVPANDIGVMCPYRDQVALISARLSDVEVNTVDQYQGRDKSVIIYSATRSTPPKEGVSDILGDKKRLTVAITRAKHKLILVCCTSVLEWYPLFKALIECASPQNVYSVSI